VQNPKLRYFKPFEFFDHTGWFIAWIGQTSNLDGILAQHRSDVTMLDWVENGWVEFSEGQFRPDDIFGRDML
jgi:hypothetical protein